LENLNSELKIIKAIAYDNCSLVIAHLEIEPEGQAYKACQFRLNGLKVICRNAKITPKKNGQFVTFWRRNENGITEPYHERDEIAFYIINVVKENKIGQFVFPKSALIKNKIISSGQEDGKRGFRVYPNWDTPQNKQAQKTQAWQAKYFIEIDNEIDLNGFKNLYQNK
jgi:hypothetical protein